MDIRATALPEVKVLTPRRFGDARGYFCETWSAARMAGAGLDLGFVQDNESLSVQAGTLRGLHYQAPPFAQAKLVRVARARSATWRGRAARLADLRALGGRGDLGRERRADPGAARLPARVRHARPTTRWSSTRSTTPMTPRATAGVLWSDADLGIDWGLPPEA